MPDEDKNLSGSLDLMTSPACTHSIDLFRVAGAILLVGGGRGGGKTRQK